MPKKSKLQKYDLLIRQWSSLNHTYDYMSKELGSRFGLKVTRESIYSYCKIRDIKKHDPKFYPRNGIIRFEVEGETEIVTKVSPKQDSGSDEQAKRLQAVRDRIAKKKAEENTAGGSLMDKPIAVFPFSIRKLRSSILTVKGA